MARRQGGPPLSAAAAHKRWSLPILYMRPEELRIRITGSMEQVRSLQVLRNSRNRLHKETPPEILEEIDQKIAELEAALKLP